TLARFEARCVKEKTEKDGRMFPLADSSETIIDCLMHAAATSGVKLTANCSVAHVERNSGGGFTLQLARGEKMHCDRLMLATGGCRAAAAGALAVSLGHTLEAAVPPLFTFQILIPWLRELAGISVVCSEVSVVDFLL